MQVMYYGVPTRLRDIANISTPEPRLIVISPYDPTALSEIEKSILAANLGVTPRNDGRVVRVPIPELNEERRRELTKVAAQYSESAKVAIRNVRRDGMDQIKKAKAAGMGEDDQKMWSEEVQELTDKAIANVDKALEVKQQEIMQV